MPARDKYTDPKLRDEVKEELKQSDKGGAPGQWSARKAQMMAKEYKQRGGDYNTDKSEKDESQKNLSNWGDEQWQTKEGSAYAKQEDGSRKRYLPKKAWENMTEEEKEATDQKKQKGSKKGTQFVANTSKARRERKNASQHQDNPDGIKTSAPSKQKTTRKKQPESPQDEADTSEGTGASGSGDAEKENQRPPKRGQKRARDVAGDESAQKETKTTNKRQKSASTGRNEKTAGSKPDKADAPAAPAALDRLPKKGQKAHWKALPGWVEGEVVEVLKRGKKVDRKDVKASAKDPKIVLKSQSSGKICVHKVNNVFFG